MSNQFADLSVKDLEGKLRLVSEFSSGSKVFQVVDQDALLNGKVGVKPPYVGVVYEGLERDGSDPKASRGLSANLRCSILLASHGTEFGGVNQKSKSMVLLDKMRDQIKGTTSPTGHPWVFGEEFLAPFTDEYFIYVQQWTTKAMLTAK